MASKNYDFKKFSKFSIYANTDIPRKLFRVLRSRKETDDFLMKVAIALKMCA